LEDAVTDKLEEYRRSAVPLPEQYRLWPLYGAGLENMGRDGQPIDVPLPTYGPDELLIRHDACGLCFSDIKVITQGQSHPRIFKDMKTDPVVLGHEVSMTVVGVGENLKDRYKVGDRLSMEPEVITKGRVLAYGYWFQGGLSQYSVIGPEFYESDTGNNLIHVKPETGYAEIGLAEPWACVVAAYTLKYRTGLKAGGALWVIGAGDRRPFTIQSGFDAAAHPNRLLLTNVPAAFDGWLRQRAAGLNVEVIDVPDLSNPPVEFVDDIVLLGADPDLIEKVSSRLDQFGVLAIMAQEPMPRKVNVDVGRIHYHRWVYVGSTGLDIAAAYSATPVRSALRPGGKAWFVGAGGPMGRMHVQRAIEFSNPPGVIVCTDVSDMRLDELCTAFARQAHENGIRFVCLNPLNKADYEAGMAEFKESGFDDIVVLAPIPPVISDAGSYLARDGVMNVFAGVARGTMAGLDLSQAYLKNTRVIGHSASGMEDMLLVLDKTYAGELSPNRSVAAIGSLSAAREGLQAVKDASLAGKVVIYPNIKDMPLTPLPELKEKLPTVYALLDERGEWTNAAEAEFLRLMLP
jgi:threonine dehydrogenase-like Zn-dependent dehydrogenase